MQFAVRDYDSHFDFDGLSTRNKKLAVNETNHLFVEFKLDLKKDFNHSFENLEAILCWNARLKDGETVVDPAGRRATYQITTQNNRKTRFIVVPGSARMLKLYLWASNSRPALRGAVPLGRITGNPEDIPLCL